MSRSRYRPLFLAAAGLLTVWLLAGLGFSLARHAKVTADTVMAYMDRVDPGALTGADRQRALQDLARQINALPPEERRQVRLGGKWNRWFDGLTEQEKGDFIEATMPSGFKQMLASFEQLPEEKRRKTVNDALRDLRQAREAMAAERGTTNGINGAAGPGDGTNGAPVLSEELQRKVMNIGLKSFYSESSAQTKAELAPVLEEMQRSMEGGALFRRPRE